MQSASQLQIVQRMIDAGEPEENIAKVIQKFKADGLPPTQAQKPKDRQSGLATLGDFVVGALKGGGETAINLGAMLHKIPGVSQVVDSLEIGPGGMPQMNIGTLMMSRGESGQAFQPARELMAPTNTAQSVGKGVEQFAELVAPAGAIGRAGKAASVLTKSALPATGVAARVLPTAANMAVQGSAGAMQGTSQGGNATAAGILTSAVPLVGGAVSKVIGPAALKSQAAKQVMQALGPTKERFKAMGAKITPEVLKRGLTGSREALKEQSAEMVAKIGPEIDNAIQAYGQRTASVMPIMQALEDSKAPFQMVVSGKTVALEPRALKQINALQKVIADTGGTATVEQLVGVRRAWDAIVSQAGGYQQRAAGAIGVPLADQSEAAVKREGAKAIREVLDAAVPELSAINKEYAFWRLLDDVLGQTLSRTQPQSQGLGRKVIQGAGMGVGAFAGSGAGPMGMAGSAMLGGAAAKMIDRAITSPAWALTSAKLKDRLAEAMMSGKQAQIAEATSRILAVQASKVGR